MLAACPVGLALAVRPAGLAETPRTGSAPPATSPAALTTDSCGRTVICATCCPSTTPLAATPTRSTTPARLSGTSPTATGRTRGGPAEPWPGIRPEHADRVGAAPGQRRIHQRPRRD